jgi:hypothetical protein
MCTYVSLIHVAVSRIHGSISDSSRQRAETRKLFSKHDLGRSDTGFWLLDFACPLPQVILHTRFKCSVLIHSPSFLIHPRALRLRHHRARPGGTMFGSQPQPQTGTRPSLATMPLRALRLYVMSILFRRSITRRRKGRRGITPATTELSRNIPLLRSLRGTPSCSCYYTKRHECLSV